MLLFMPTATRPEAIIRPFLGQQCLVRAFLFNAFLAQHDNAIRILKGRSAMRNRKRGAAFRKGLQTTLDENFAFII